jgi:hypothetical protein
VGSVFKKAMGTELIVDGPDIGARSTDAQDDESVNASKMDDDSLNDYTFYESLSEASDDEQPTIARAEIECPGPTTVYTSTSL